MNPPHVVILGAGFGGLYAARALARAPVRVTVVDRRNHHLFQPLLYQVATAALAAPDIAAPIRGILRHQENATVLLAEARGIDLASRRVTTDAGGLDYDFLIVATGSTHSWFGHDEWAPFAPGLKDVEDAFEIRSRILLAFERAEAAQDADERRQWLTFVVVGGGPTGVELAGAIGEIAQKTLARNFRTFDPREARVVLVDGSDRVLPSFPEESSRDALRLLRKKGVEVVLGARATAIDGRGVELSGAGRIEARTVLWAAGVAMSPLAGALGAPLDRQGRVLVAPDLSLPGHPEVFVVGDLAAVEQKGEFLPGVAQPAIQGGRAAARNIVRRARGEATLPFRYKDLGTMATIGRSAAVAIVGGRRFSGYVAWLLWLFIHVTWLIGFRNRLVVLLEWTWAYVTWGRGARVILDRRAWPPPATAPAPALAFLPGLVAVLASISGCASDSTAPPLPPPQLRVDAAPAWSHDGTRVAFARRVPSSFGPEGLYAMDWPGGTPFLVRAIQTDGILGLTFSADDSTLLASQVGFVSLYPVGGGFTDSWGGGMDLAPEPDASHDGTTVAYVGWHAGQASIRFHHPGGGPDSVVTAAGLPLVGTHPRFSPGDSLVAYVGGDGLFVWRRATGQRIRVTTASGPPSAHFGPRWLDSSRILFDQRAASGDVRSFVIDRTTGVVVEIPGGLGGSEAISAGRDSILIEGYDRSDPELSKIVLFVRGLTSPQASARQVTTHEPQAAGP